MRILDSIKHPLRALGKVFQSGSEPAFSISTGHKVIDSGSLPELYGWQQATVAQRQHQAFLPLLKEVREGHPRLDFEVAAQAIATTGLANPYVIEVGCGSGYYSETLPLLLGQSIRYLGVDYSASMISLARAVYPGVEFLIGDACHLPLASDACDVLLSGTSLMHIANYRLAIAETVRVSGQWCLFHTVPIMMNQPTTLMVKEAYGKEVIEVIFNKDELEEIFSAHKLTVEAEFASIPYDVSSVVGAPTWTLTYLCRKS
jgi:SAM-dependent methyltransferase